VESAGKEEFGAKPARKSKEQRRKRGARKRRATNLVDIVRVKQFTALDAARLRAALIGMFEGRRQLLLPDAPIRDR